jgi:hypothetical protein
VFTQNGSATGTLTVVSRTGGFDLDSYRNGDGRVGTAGLQAAINDFLRNDIDTGNLQSVINEFVRNRAG